MDRVTYDRVLLLDLYPNSDYPHVTVVSFANTGIPVAQLESMKMTRDVRLQPRDLPIYGDDTHEYYIIAKIESDCDRREEGRASYAVNEFVHEHLRLGIRIQDLPVYIVDNFRGRVQRRVTYVRKSEVDAVHTVAPSSFRKRPMVSSSDPEGLQPVNHKQNLDLRSIVKKPKVDPKAANKASPTMATASSPMPPPPTAATPQARTTATPPLGFHDLQADALDPQLVDDPGAVEHNTQPVEPQTPTGHSLPRHSSSSLSGKSQPNSQRSSKDGHGPCDNCLRPVLERCESLNVKIDRTHKKLSGGLRVNVNLLEKLANDVADIKRAITALTGTTVANQSTILETTFPLLTKADIDKYLDDDPTANNAMLK